MFRIESLLSARLFLAPQIAGQRIYFISNLSGRMSLYAMDYGGRVPEPLLPPNLAMQNPDLMEGKSFHVFPGLGKILVMLDHDGDENYQPMWIPLEGGFPEPAFGGALAAYRTHLGLVTPDDTYAYMVSESREVENSVTFRANVATGELEKLTESQWFASPAAASTDQCRVVIIENYTMGDSVLSLWEKGQQGLSPLYGVPLDQRQPGQVVPPVGINSIEFTPDDRGLLLTCAVFTDIYGPAYLDLENPGAGFQEVKMEGLVHQGAGEMVMIRALQGDRYSAEFNIDGCSWLYEGTFDRPSLTLKLEHVVVGVRPPRSAASKRGFPRPSRSAAPSLANGKLDSCDYDRDGDRFILSYSTATSPTQLYTVEGPRRERIVAHTRERVLGIAPDLLSTGEDASFISFDGRRVSARLYLPAASLGYQGPRPLVYYIHGGPQGQERPDFAWFSMPLIQFLALNGFAVFVPNARGSTGYGMDYTRQVDRDWGGQDRLDHVHAMQVLKQEPRVDVTRAGVVGRSYGGYMTLTLAGRHPELWAAAVDMFGPYDLLTFMDRIPETWKPYFRIAVGDPEKDRDLLVERSPRTYIDQVTCPMLVIQGKNDPRVIERESRDLVERLRGQGKQVEYLMFENEGHDVLKYENRVSCYTAITDFFKQYLKP